MDATNVKIKQIIEECNLTPSRFADEIGVQRAIISHILAGRNKPSLDIIVKINKWNSSYTLDYFTDEGLLEPNSMPQTPHNEPVWPRNTAASKPLDLNRKIQANNEPKFSNEKKIEEPYIINEGGKQVERILIFYTDKTFTEYRPG
jgi:transcriptional regulator with XRE-family HTH domain